MKVTINDLDRFGRGRTKIDNKITFVYNALKDEEVDIEITNETKKYNEAKVISYDKESDKRRNAPCLYYSLCGGCQIMHMNYDSQLEFKKNKFKEILNRSVSYDKEIDIEPSNKELGYRNKITLHNKDNTLGYMKENTNEIVEIDKCLIANDSINGYLKEIKNYKEEDLIIRCNDNNEIISNIKNDYIIETINNYNFRVDINSFFQVNSYIYSKIFDHIENIIKKNKVALDLYSGVGTLSILISSKCNKVYSIEVNKSSYENAKENLKLNNVNNVTLLCGKVENEIKKIKEDVDLIVTDPPRNGMDKITIDTIKKFKPKSIIYMSCEPVTLSRDLTLLNDMYEIKNIKLFDMFPNTYHVETICILERKKV